jgi:hypothetical protein
MNPSTSSFAQAMTCGIDCPLCNFAHIVGWLPVRRFARPLPAVQADLESKNAMFHKVNFAHQAVFIAAYPKM